MEDTPKVGKKRQKAKKLLLTDWLNGVHLTYNDRKIRKMMDEEPMKEPLWKTHPDVPVYWELLKHWQESCQEVASNPAVAFSWVLVPMPEQFNYTVTIMRNHARQGLLHTIIRHSTHWTNLIPEFSEILEKIPVAVLGFIQEIERETNIQRTSDLITEYIEMYRAMDPNGKRAFSQLQMRVWQFLTDNTVYSSYLGEYVTENEKVQVYFRVKSEEETSEVMTLCVTVPANSPDSRFDDKRPTRIITTVFFNSEEEASRRRIAKLFSDEKKCYV